MTKPSELLETLASPEVERWLAHPTVAGMSDGTLPLHSFQWWARQNYAYLKNYVRVYAKLAVVAPDAAMEVFVDAAHNLAIIELGLYRELGKKLGVDFDEPVVPTELNLAYQSFLREQADDYGVGLAAALPCLWAFTTMGRRMPVPPEDGSHPYGLWLRTYQGTTLREKVDRLLALLDAADPPIDKVDAVVRTALDYEIRYWDIPHLPVREHSGRKRKE